MSIRDPDLRGIATDPDAFEAFYREHVGAIQRFVARRVHDPEQAADLTSDIVMTVINRSSEYRPERGPAIAWVFGIARTVVAESQRQRFRERRAVNRFAALLPLQPDAMARAVERLDAERHSRRLYAAMARLPEGQRAVLELVALDGLSPAEAAQTLGISLVSARVRLHRARSAMRSHLSNLSHLSNPPPDPPAADAPSPLPSLTTQEVPS